MHQAAYDYVQQEVKAHGPFDRVLDLGGRDVNGSVRDLFSGLYLVVDIRCGPGVDIVDDAAEYLGFPPFDCVLCLETLEHTARAPEIVANAHRNLRQGGVFIATTACAPRLPHSAIDGCELRPGEYYSNIEVPTMEAWLEAAGFVVWEVDTIQLPDHGGDLRATAWR